MPGVALEPELRCRRMGGGCKGRRKLEKHYRDNFVTAFRRDQARQARIVGEILHFAPLLILSCRGEVRGREKRGTSREVDESRERPRIVFLLF